MQPAPKRIEIAKYPHGKKKAFTTSWDDGVVHDRRVVQYFNEIGIKGTWNLNSAFLTRPGVPDGRPGHYLAAAEVAELYKGHEVAIHTATHPHLPMLDPSAMAYEILDDRRALEDLVGYPVRGMALPFGSWNKQVLDMIRTLGIVYCRATGQAVENTFPPADPIFWQPTMHMFGKVNDQTMPEKFAAWVAQPKRTDVMFVWGHTYEFNQPTPRWDDLEKLFRPVAGHPDVWYCTNIELFDYEAARQRMVIAANKRSAYNPSAVTVTLVVDGKAVDVPGGQTVTLV